MRRSTALTLVGISLLLLLLPAGCSSKKKKAKADDPGLPVAAAVKKGDKDKEKGGLTIRVTPGDAPDGAGDRTAVDPGTPLDDAAVKALLARLSPLTGIDKDKVAFAFRDRSLPAPRTGLTVQSQFPPPAKPPVPDAKESGDLEVLRFSPEGKVNLAPRVSVTFSQPMVPVTSHADTIAQGVPVSIAPALPGKWRWIGTKTLLWESDGPRIPMATTFTVTVPAGTASATGGKLPKAVTWTFATPPPRLLTSHPSYGPQRLDPVILMGFDQKIDARAVLATTKLEADGKTLGLRMATDKEIAADERAAVFAKASVKAPQKDRVLLLVATERLKPDTSYTVTVGPGTPSQEGPERTTEPQTFGFKTYEPLKILRSNCEEKYPCTPPAQLYLTFNNPLDEKVFDKKSIRVEPAIKDMMVIARHSSIAILGKTKGRTTYTVTVPASLKDAYGQILGSQEERRFYLKEAQPSLSSRMRRFVTLDPSGDKTYVVQTVNHPKLRLKIHAVDPGDWPEYLKYANRYGWPRDPPYPTLPGKQLVNQLIDVKDAPDEEVETRIPLKAHLNAAGHGLLVVEVQDPRMLQGERHTPHVSSFVQVTDLAVDVFEDGTELLAWVSRLKDGAPVSGAQVKLVGGASGSTDAKGLTRVALTEVAGSIVVASTKDDRAMLPDNADYYGRGAWRLRSAPGEGLRWFVFDDRKLYKPKEEVRIKGWVRIVDMGRKAGLRLIDGPGATVGFVVFDPRGNKIGQGSVPVNPLGGFDLRFSLPDAANLGNARVTLACVGCGTYAGASTQHTFKIQEFRRPEFEVSSTGSPGPHLLGGHADVAATASYFSGGPLPGAETTWQVTASPGFFHPPGWTDYTFVGWFPSWAPDAERARTNHVPFKGMTDGRGTHRIRIHFDAMDPARPYSVNASATIMDVNRQTWSTSTALLVHPSKHYIGLRTKTLFVKQGTPLKMDVIVTDWDGKAVPDQKFTVTAVRQHHVYEKGKYEVRELDPQTCAESSKAEPVTCTFQTAKGGNYILRAVVVDPAGHVNRTTLTRWVTGGGLPPARKVELEPVRLIADKDTYQPGDTAEVLVQAPFYPAEGLMTLQRQGIIHTERFRMEEATTTLRVPIAEDHLPDLRMQVNLVGSAARLGDQGDPVKGAPRRPAHAVGSINLSVPPLRRSLQVTVKPRQSGYRPGAKATIDVTVQDADKKPVAGAEVALVVVDESVLALTGYKLGSPLHHFYPSRSGGVSSMYSRGLVQLEDPEQLAERLRRAETEEAGMDRTAVQSAAPSMAPSGAGGRRSAGASGAPKGFAEKAKRADKADEDAPTKAPAREPGAPITLRTNFSALALFEPALPTDAAGKATVTLTLPDSLTRYRIMALSVAEAKLYGYGDSNLAARQPLQLRPAAPRFLNFGDQLEVPIVVQNQTDAELKVKVAVRASNLKFMAGQGKLITVPANDRREVRFAATTESAGTARVQVAASTGDHADAAEVSLPVWTPATTEAFATYGTIDQGSHQQPVMMPNDVIPGFGNLEVSTSSTALQALTDAVLYLYAYPYECSEQLASRILAVAALRDVLAAFQSAGLPPPAVVAEAMARDLTKLYNMQNDDGGWPWWMRGYRSSPFNTIHVTHALARAKAKGYAMNERMITTGHQYLKDIERHIDAEEHPWPESTKRIAVAYSLYVRALLGDMDITKAKATYAYLKGLSPAPLEGIAWLYPVLSGHPEAKAEVAEIRHDLNKRITETAGAAHFTTTYSDGAHLILHSDRRVDGLFLEGLIKDVPKHDVIPKIVTGLLAHRTRGRWANTQESAWVLLALDRYFATYESVTPNFVARVWLGDRYAGDHKFAGRTTERHLLPIPLRYLGEPGKTSNLLLAKDGPGRLYYRIGMTYAPSDLRPPPANHGFEVRRRYEGVDDPKHVTRRPDGIWEIKAGARVRVVVTMVAQARRYHVALVDPLPAGLEPINGELLGAEPAPAGKAAPLPTPRHHGRGYRGHTGYRSFHWWRPSSWYDHQNLRDERAEVFTGLLHAGVWVYQYTARATTPGRFVAPPPKAEEMYMPETFGRGPGDIVVVK
jgi:hypothetical protein